ncbi:hypothetical protein D1871_06555 [Nakamurella silvestris]|nr:hypothetical protein D1871_06555 [Nakamurella silvestris]
MLRRTVAAFSVSAALLLSGGAFAVTPAMASSPARPAVVAAPSALAPTQLRVGGQAADALVGSTRPTFGWAPQDSGRAQSQTAYQLRLAEVPADHGQARTDVWDSGRISSADSTGVEYGGPALVADHTYEWSVRTWNADLQVSPWSQAQRFDVGLLAVGDWSASWLRIGDGALARTSFSLDKPIARARLYVGAQGLVETHLNGALVDPSQVLDSSATDFTKRVVYRGFDVTDQLTTGTNALAVAVGKGSFNADPTFIAQLSVTYSDGSRATFGTDANWRSTTGPVTSNDFYYGQTYDARKAISGWDSAGFDAAGWTMVPVFAPVAGVTSLARNRPVTALDETACCGWSRAALVDGINFSTNDSQGYHSATSTTANSPKWVQVDLGAARAISRVTLFPAHPTNDTAGDFAAAGFPVRYRVLVSDDPTFATSTTFANRGAADQPSPGDNPVPVEGAATGRYVRVAADVLGCRDTSCTFRLAELGVYAPDQAPTFGYTALEADTTPPSRIIDTLEPTTVLTAGDGTTVYDFGQNYVGQVTLTADAPAGTTAAITKGEILAGNGRVSTANISFAPSEPVRQSDRYVFDSSGTQTWTPTLNYAGFRYAEVTGLPAGTTVRVKARVVHNDVERTGSFTTSDPLLNSIQDAVTRTQLNNLQQGMPLDCPTREKHGWLGDAGDSNIEAMANFDMQSFYDKWLGDVRTSINANGSVTSVAPVQGRANEFVTDPAWGSAYPQIVWDAYTEYGDASVLTANYSQIRQWVEYLGTIADANHIIVNSPGSWGDDWLATVSTPHVYFQTLFYLLDSRLLAKMATALGNTADAQRYSTLAEAITTDFNRKYFDPATDVYGTGAQLSYAMPLALGIVPTGHEQAVLGKLITDITNRSNHVTTGFVGTTFVYQALGAYGRNDIALKIAQRTDYPSFGYMVTQGPGTIWEKWDNSQVADGTSSKDHIGLGGAIGQWYYQQLAGIRPGTAGYRTFTLAPSVVGNLTHVAASQLTVRGTITSEWTKTGNDLVYRATIPVGSVATVILPAKNVLAVTEGGHALTDATGVEVTSANGSQVTLAVGSGSYVFSVSAAAESLASVVDRASALKSQVAGLAGDGSIGSAPAATLTAAAASIVDEGTTTLPLLQGDPAAAAANIVHLLRTARQLRTTLDDPAVTVAARAALLAPVGDLVGALSELATTAAGLTVTLDGGGTVGHLPGDTFTAAATISNTGTVPLTAITAAAALPDGWTAEPSTVRVEDLAPGGSRSVSFAVTVGPDQLPGVVRVPVEVTFNYLGTDIVTTATTSVTIASAAAITAAVLEPAAVTPTSVTTAKVTLTNSGSTALTGRVAIGVPAGWVKPLASATVVVPGHGAVLVPVRVFVPTDLDAEQISLPVSFSRSGVDLAVGTATGNAVVGVPTAADNPYDHIDLGDATSEAAHNLTKSGTSGTSPEGGLSRRYTGADLNSYFAFDMNVPIGKPFIVNAIETFDAARTKEYTVKVNGVLVQNHLFTRKINSSGVSSYQFLVDDPAALSTTGKVTVTFTRTSLSNFDPSIADAWTLPAPTAVPAPTVRADLSPAVPDGRDGWYVTAPELTLSGQDFAGRTVTDLQYRTGAGSFVGYVAPVRITGDGAVTLSYRGTSGGSTSAVSSTDIKVDTAPPVTTATKSGTGSVTVTLTATDPTSGVGSTRYRIGDGSWVTYSTPFQLAAGSRPTVVSYRSTDTAGNVESAREITVDAAPGRADSTTAITVAAPTVSTKGFLEIAVTVTAPAMFTGRANLYDGNTLIATGPLFEGTSSGGTNPLFEGRTSFREAGSGLATGRRQYSVTFTSSTTGIGDSTSAATAVEVYFFDKAPGSSFYTEVQWLAESGITTGVDGGGFDPTGLVGRQAMAAFLYRLTHPDSTTAPACVTAPFVDVPVGSPFCGEIAWLKTTDITTGYTGGRFQPGATVDRQAMAAFLYRLTHAGATTPACTVAPFTDVPIGSPFCGEIAWLKTTDITTGYTGGRFQPGEKISRQAMAAFLYRLEHQG